MDLNYSVADLEFRERLQAFLDAELPPELRESPLEPRGLDAGHIRRWQRILAAHGWGAIHWPAKFGGRDATPVQQYLFQLECSLRGAPVQPAFGLRMLAPVLMRFGSAEQQSFFLPRILNAEHWWCQGYSEPDAGSDLAALKTRAVRDGDRYRVTGQKTWNTLGQHADWIFCLVKTDLTVKPQQGISLLLIDMKTPGITVRPIRLLDGTAEVNEVWFDDVPVPVANRVGEENQGWSYAKFLLGHERANIAGVGNSKRDLTALKHIAAAARYPSAAAAEAFWQRIARVEIDLLALEYTNLRLLTARNDSSGLAQASMLKIRGSEIRQAISELLVEALGDDALRDTAGFTAAYLNLRKLSIFGGTNEIQRNIIAQSLVGP